MTDRTLCRKCIYSEFQGSHNRTYFNGCNYLIYTGQKRPHNGDECLGYTSREGKSKRKRVDIVVSERSTAIYTETAPKAKADVKPKSKCKHPDPDREIRAAAKRIIKARNAMV